ncbi:hypothetical protein ACFR97_17520 [Haloplanus litoreus]|uniref:Secreted protein n=1 Tax=Haloplanus litoreus TaxID=767515 RepID=A0ABD5ZYR1_9EURY
MEIHTIAAASLLILAAVALFVAARAGAVAHGLLPAAPGTTESDGEGGKDGGDGDGDGSGGSGVRRSAADDEDAVGDPRWRITEDDRERMRKHLDKTRGRRSPDDLLPSEEEDAESDGS